MLGVATRRYASHSTQHSPHLPLSFTIPISIRIRIRFRISISIGIGHCTWPKEREQHGGGAAAEEGAEGGAAAAKRSEAKQTKTKPNPTEARWEENRIEAMTAMQFYSCRLNGWRHMDAKQ